MILSAKYDIISADLRKAAFGPTPYFFIKSRNVKYFLISNTGVYGNVSTPGSRFTVATRANKLVLSHLEYPVTILVFPLPAIPAKTVTDTNYFPIPSPTICFELWGNVNKMLAQKYDW